MSHEKEELVKKKIADTFVQSQMYFDALETFVENNEYNLEAMKS